MCTCTTTVVCPYHADQIMTVLAEARDANDRGDITRVAELMAGLYRDHGEHVNLVIAEVREGLLDLSQYGTPVRR